MTNRWKQRPPGSNWGDFGPDDQRGRMNWVTREKVLQGIAEVKEGITFCCSLPLDYPGGTALNPRRHPPRLAATLRDSGKNKGRQNFCYPLAEDREGLTDVVCDDITLLTLQYSTQWDSFAHIGSRFDADGDGQAEIVFYNGFRAGEDVVPAADKKTEGWDRYEGTQARALGIEKLAEHGAQGRGVMIDLHAHFGRKREVVGYDTLMQVLERDRVSVERGDMVCLHTGFAQMLIEMGGKPDKETVENACAVFDGRDQRLLQWITDTGLAVLIADNYAVEAHPATSHVGCCATLPLHEHCLFKLGVNLGELWHLTPLAQWLREHSRYRFLLTAPPLRLPGAVGSPATPIATV